MHIPSENFINGQWVSTGTGSVDVLNKYSCELIATLPNASESQMEEAISASVTAFNKMRKWPAQQRQDKLFKLVDLLEKEKDAFAELIAREAGKPIGYAKGEVARCCTTLRLAAEEAARFTGETVNVDYNAGKHKEAFTRRVPIGPVAAISPFNFPLNLALHKIAPAFAVGCSVVLKPSPLAPLSSLAFARLAEEAGYPAGALNVLLADIPIAQKLVEDERMKLLSFTGSPEIGWQLKALAGKKKVVLELGGNAAVYVDATADLEQAARACAIGAYLYAGQICISTQRIYVDQMVARAFEEELLEEILKLKCGNPMDEEVAVSSVINKHHLHRIDGWVKEAIDQGATLITGGKVVDEQANVYAPTLLTNAKKGMKVLDEEVFGPVATLQTVDSFEEAMQAMNDSRFGLQAGIFTNQLSQFKAAPELLEVGGIMFNNIPGFRVDGMPYGGVKDSGLGREGLRYAMEDMTEGVLVVY